MTWGSHTPPPECFAKRGPQPKITPAAREGLRVFLQEKSWAYQDEMQDSLLDDYKIIAHQSEISKLLKEMKINKKSLRKEAAERS